MHKYNETHLGPNWVISQAGNRVVVMFNIIDIVIAGTQASLVIWEDRFYTPPPPEREF